MEKIEILKINQRQWDEINNHHSLTCEGPLDEDQAIVFALDNHLHGYYKGIRIENNRYRIKAIQPFSKVYKVYCYNLAEELKHNREKVKALFASRAKEPRSLRLKIIIKSDTVEYLWCPGAEELISQGQIKIKPLPDLLKTPPDVRNKKLMFSWYHSLVPSPLIGQLKKYQLVVIQLQRLPEEVLPHFPFPFFFDGDHYLGEKMMFLFSFEGEGIGAREKESNASWPPASISLVGNLHLSDDNMEREMEHIYKYLSYVYPAKKIKRTRREFKQEDFLFELQNSQYLHYIGHAGKEGLVFFDAISSPAAWLRVNDLPQIMVFSCCEFLSDDLAMKLLQKGVQTLLAFEGTVESTGVHAFVKDMYWQWVNAGVSFLEAVFITFKKHLKTGVTFYPKVYGQGSITWKR